MVGGQQGVSWSVVLTFGLGEPGGLLAQFCSIYFHSEAQGVKAEATLINEVVGNVHSLPLTSMGRSSAPSTLGF